MKTIFIMFCLAMIFNVGYAEPLQQYTVHYAIQEGDTLDSIAQHFFEQANIPCCDKQYKAFREGIIEINYEKIKDGLKVGEIIIINYWK